jgi:hypothetical protein
LAVTLKMKNKLLALGIIALLSCEQKITPGAETGNSDSQPISESLGEKEFWIEGINKEDFNIRESGDTTFYNTQLYEGIEGKKIKFEQAALAEIGAEIRYEIGFLQYTTDDVPAFPLIYTKKSNWVKLAVENGLLKIPSFHGDSTHPAAFEALGFKNNEELLNWIIAEDFKDIKAESLQEQTDFYKNLIKEKSRYEKCCPEYIEQAENFLKTPTKEYNSIDKLGLEQNFKSMTILIKGRLKSGEEFKKVIVGQ